MRLPKFWKDTGRYNDYLITLTIVAGIALGAFASSHFPVPWWARIFLIIVGLIVGLVLGFGVMHILCTYFSED